MTRKQALAFRQLVELGAKSLDDKAVSTAPDVLPRMQYNGRLIENGTRINWNGVVKRARVDLWDTAENTPDAAPDLWEDIVYYNGIRIIPETITSTLAFKENELGYWKKTDTVYKSKQNGNVWTPEQYADAWEVYEENVSQNN